MHLLYDIKNEQCKDLFDLIQDKKKSSWFWVTQFPWSPCCYLWHAGIFRRFLEETSIAEESEENHPLHRTVHEAVGGTGWPQSGSQ